MSSDDVMDVMGLFRRPAKVPRYKTYLTLLSL